MKTKSAKLEPSSLQTPLEKMAGMVGGGGGGAVDAGNERKCMTNAENVCVCVTLFIVSIKIKSPKSIHCDCYFL